ncbi:MAG: DUF2892 domain-containing protein [Candidatus Nanohalobium sp.]
MKENVGDKDRKIRIGVGSILVGLGALGQSGLLDLSAFLPSFITSVTLSILGLFLVVEGYFSKCMLYRVLGISTKED